MEPGAGTQGSGAEACGPAQRLRVVRQHAELRGRGEPEPVESDSNDTWFVDDRARGACVLRIAWRGDRGRLVTEAKVGRALPREIGYPDVLGFGWTRDEHDLTWTLTRRLPGRTLADAWSDLTEPERGQAGRDIATLLRILHRWRPSAAVSDRLQARPPDRTASDVVGATLNPLPLARLALLLDAAEESGVDTSLVHRAYGWLLAHAELEPELDRPGLPVLHGDLRLANVWCTGRRVTGLLDLEWARLGPAHLDLARLDDTVEADELRHGPAHRQIRELVVRAYPELLVPRLADRLRFFRLAYAVRELFTWPASGGTTESPDHPAQTIRALTA